MFGCILKSHHEMATDISYFEHCTFKNNIFYLWTYNKITLQLEGLYWAAAATGRTPEVDEPDMFLVAEETRAKILVLKANKGRKPESQRLKRRICLNCAIKCNFLVARNQGDDKCSTN